MQEDELTEKLLEEFDTNPHEAGQVSMKVAKYIDDTEESEFTKEMRDPEYVPAVLRSNTSSAPSLTSRWNQWIGQFTKNSSYQID